MSDEAPRRTIRRCAAVLAVPLSLYPMVFVARLERDGYPYSNVVLETADEIAMATLLGAVGYLVGSVLYQWVRTGKGPEMGDTATRTD